MHTAHVDHELHLHRHGKKLSSLDQPEVLNGLSLQWCPGPLAGTHAHEVMSITEQLLAHYDDRAGQQNEDSTQHGAAASDLGSSGQVWSSFLRAGIALCQLGGL